MFTLNRRFTLSLLQLCYWAALFLASDSAMGDGLTKDKKLEVGITTHLGDKQQFQQGDRLTLLITLSDNAYLVLIYKDATNKLEQIYPNRWSAQTVFPAGYFQPFPSTTNPFEFIVSEPYGQEEVWLVASRKPFSELFFKDIKKLHHSSDGSDPPLINQNTMGFSRVTIETYP
ncbi:MAG: DUF4384 domain-containing protein [Pseudomonadales bacterium]|nr:DUF4384 domain-containing protein [Pseudomonadales bacterium]